MSIANLHFFRIFIHVSHPLYIRKHNQKAAMNKEGLEWYLRTKINLWVGLLQIHQLSAKKQIFLNEEVFFFLTSPFMGDPNFSCFVRSITPALAVE